MVKKSIVWTQTAAKQRRKILNYWNERNRSTTYSKKLVFLIRRRLSTLCEFPESGKKSDFTNTRVTSIGYYSIFYQIRQDKLIITAFWDTRQDPKELYVYLLDPE